MIASLILQVILGLYLLAVLLEAPLRWRLRRRPGQAFAERAVARLMLPRSVLALLFALAAPAMVVALLDPHGAWLVLAATAVVLIPILTLAGWWFAYGVYALRRSR
jgi:hypothetical protein